MLELLEWTEFQKQMNIFIQIVKGKEIKSLFAIQSKNGAGIDS